MARQSRDPTILLTRPLSQSERFAEALRSVTDLPVLISPLMETLFLPWQRPAGQLAAIILTSEAGAQEAGAMRDDLPDMAWCVGRHTADVARAMGFTVRVGSGDAAGLVQAIAQFGQAGPLLHLRGVHTRGAIAETLTNRGIVTHEAVVYDQRPASLTDAAAALITGNAPLVVPVFSPRSARLLCAAVGQRSALFLGAISPAVADELVRLAPAALEIADSPDANGMLLAVQRLVTASCCS